MQPGSGRPQTLAPRRPKRQGATPDGKAGLQTTRGGRIARSSRPGKAVFSKVGLFGVADGPALAEYVRRVREKGGAVTLDIRIEADGSLYPEQLEVLSHLRDL